VVEWGVNQHFDNHPCPQNVGLLAIQPPDAAARQRIFF